MAYKSHFDAKLVPLHQQTSPTSPTNLSRLAGSPMPAARPGHGEKTIRAVPHDGRHCADRPTKRLHPAARMEAVGSLARLLQQAVGLVESQLAGPAEVGDGLGFFAPLQV